MEDVAGLFFAFTSMLLLAAYVIYIKRTGYFLQEQMVMTTQFALLSLPLAALSAALEPAPYFAPLAGMGPEGVATLALLSVRRRSASAFFAFSPASSEEGGNLRSTLPSFPRLHSWECSTSATICTSGWCGSWGRRSALP